MSTPNENVKSELAAALDHAEATVPALHRLRSQYGCVIVGPMYAYGRNWHEANQSYELQWKPPRHRAVAAYWRVLKASIFRWGYVEDDLRTCRNRFKEAREIYENKTLYRARDVEWSDGGKGVSLRAILDARAAMVEAFAILKQVEGEAKYWRQIQANKRAAERDAKLRRRHPHHDH